MYFLLRCQGIARSKDIAEIQVPAKLKQIVIVTILPLKPNQLLEVFRLIDHGGHPVFFLEKGNNKTGGSR